MNMFLRGIFLRRKIMRYFVLLLALATSSNVFAQTHTFTEVTQNPHHGIPSDVAVGPDGTVFVLNREGDFCAYEYDGSSISSGAYINGNHSGNKIEVWLDGTVFIAGADGLFAYAYDGTSFSNTAWIDEDGKIAVGADGTVFLADNVNGLRAYNYDGTSFTNTAQIGLSNQWVRDVTVGPDGTVFTVTPDSLHLFSYDGSSFTNMAWIDVGGSLAVGPDGTIFVCPGTYPDTLFAYTYDGTAFTNTTYIELMGYPALIRDIEVGSDGTVFLWREGGDWEQNNKLSAFSYDGSSFTHISSSSFYLPTNWVDGPTYDMVVSPDGDVFIVYGDHENISWTDRFVAFEFDGTTLHRTVYTTVSGVALSLSVTSDGTVFLANGFDGLRTYILEGTTFTNTMHKNTDLDTTFYSFTRANDVKIGPDGTVFVGVGSIWGTCSLYAYSYNGTTIDSIASMACPCSFGINTEIGLDGTVFRAHGDSLFAYTCEGSSFTNIASANIGGTVGRLAVGPDGAVFLANVSNGLRAYTYDGTSFTNTAQIDLGDEEVYDMEVGHDGTVFLTNASDSLKAYTYDGTSFTNTAWIDEGGRIAVGPDGTVFLAHQEDGLQAFTYDGSSFTNTAATAIDILYFRDIVVSPNGTIFLAYLNDGLIAYTYSGYSEIADDGLSVPAEYLLKQNYPNPFNPTTAISYQLSADSEVELTIYDIAGRKIKTLINEYQSSGYHKVNWNASGFSSGIYFYQLEAGDFVETRKMVFIK